jgi:CheY-like chemotaxis protein
VVGTATDGPRLAGLRVLAAEDVELNRLILEDLLLDEGARVVFAENGREALDRIAEYGAQGFDVVLMDVQMPVMDGHEATRRLREIAPNLPIIGLTAHALAEERDKSLSAGMVDQVTKPFQADELINVILRQVGVHAAHAFAATASPEPASEELIDWQSLNQRFNNRHDFLKELLTTVLDSQANTPDKLIAAARDGDLAGMSFIIHSIKGLTGNLSAASLYGEAVAAESAANAAKRDKSPESLEQVRDMANALAESVRILLREVARHQAASSLSDFGRR